MSAACIEPVAAPPSCYIKIWQCGEAAEGSLTDSHKNSSEKHRDGETETPRKQQAYSLALEGRSLMASVHRMALLGGMEP